MKVKNINGTSENDCPCRSWLNHWKIFSQQAPGLCAKNNCYNLAEVGAHVQQDSNNAWYIIPLCRDHNAQRGQTFYIGDGTPLVSANVSETCGQPN